MISADQEKYGSPIKQLIGEKKGANAQGAGANRDGSKKRVRKRSVGEREQ